MKRFSRYKKIKASALSTVVTITAVIGIIMMGVLLITGVFSKAKIGLDIRNQLILNCKSGLQFCLASSEIPNNQIIDLFDELKDSVFIQNYPFGILNYVTVSAFHGADSISKTFLIGNKSNKKERTAISIGNSNKALGVCGATFLKGNITVPERGIERVYIEGQNFVGSKLYYGTKRISTSNLPPIHPDILNNIENLFALKSGLPFPHDKDTIIGGNNQLIFNSDQEIFISSIISGNVIIQSNKAIFISATAKLDNIILKAPIVKFESNFSGNVQVFATDSIITGEKSNFTFPSFFVLKTRTNRTYSPKITLSENTIFKGNLVLLQDQFGLTNNGIININNNCIINGSIYSKGYTQLKKCKIQGSVYTKKLYLKTASSVYENTLLNVNIDPNKRDSTSIDLGLNKSTRNWIYLK